MKKLLILFVILILSFIVKPSAVTTNAVYDLTSQIIKSECADILGNGKDETVILSGVNLGDGPFYENIKITVSDSKTGTTLFSITPTKNFGYEPTIMVGDFTSDGVCEIFYGALSGNDDYGYYYLYSLNGEVKTLFDYESDVSSFNAVYENWYKVKVFNDNVYKYIDISNKKENLKSIYNNGILVKEVKANVTAVNKVYPCFNYYLNSYTLQVGRKIIGVNPNDVIGYLVETYNYTNNENGIEKDSFIII